MGVGDWLRRRFSSAPEYRDQVNAALAPEYVAGGPTGPGFQGLEDAQAADDAIHATDPPDDPAR
jgi:hypothetical protein